MRDHKRRRIVDDPLENGWTHVLEVLLGAGAMLAALLWFMMSQQ
jgi:hypothetical protein